LLFLLWPYTLPSLTDASSDSPELQASDTSLPKFSGTIGSMN
jgi:hypothetical protein